MNPRLRTIAASMLLAGVTAASAAAQPGEPEAARFRAGPLPPLPALVLGGGEVLVELDVTAEGRVETATVLRATPPFTELVLAAARQWAFEPATRLVPSDIPGEPATLQPGPSSVLVVAVFRPPTMLAPTGGELPKAVGEPSTAIPFPVTLQPPPWPPLAHAGGVVLVEARIDAGGGSSGLAVVQGAPGFDEAALETVRGWVFRPARDPDVPATVLVYVVLGFQVPVVN